MVRTFFSVLLFMHSAAFAKEYIINVDLSKEPSIIHDLQALDYTIRTAGTKTSPDWWLIDGPAAIGKIRSIDGVLLVEPNRKVTTAGPAQKCRENLDSHSVETDKE